MCIKLGNSLLIESSWSVDNGSTDKTAELALEAGADVVFEPRRGYGYACAAGVPNDAEIVVFLDGDFSSHPDEMEKLIRPIIEEKADLVLGSRMRDHMVKGSMPAHQRFGNWLVLGMMRTLYGIKVMALGPYRAIRRALLHQLDMHEMTFG